MTNTCKFVIWAPNYNEEQGGPLVLHYLCHYLNLAGYEAYLWHKGRPLRKDVTTFRQRLSHIKKGLKRRVRSVKMTSPLLKTPLACEKDLDDAVILYPEKVEGNPLGAKKVVRWFLHKPGFHTSRINYGDNELYFFYQKAFDDPSISTRPSIELYFPVVLDHTFKQTNFGSRSGICFILRKGKDREKFHDINAGTIVDGMSNQEIAKVFNASEFCISYDLYTYYSQYAAICGCKSIVVPEPGLTKEMWQPKEELHYGVAYGEEELNWAINTRSKLLEYMKEEQKTALKTVRKFAEQCSFFFSRNGD